MRTDINDDFTKLKKDDELWMTKDGVMIPITQMTLPHVFYTVNMLKTHIKNQKRIKKEYKKNNLKYPYGKIVIPDLLLERYEQAKKEYPELFL